MKDATTANTTQSTHTRGGKKTVIIQDCCTLPPGDPGPST